MTSDHDHMACVRVILGNCSGIQVVITMWNGMELLTIEGNVVN